MHSRVIRLRIGFRNLRLVRHAVLPEELHLDGTRLDFVIVEEKRVHRVAVAKDPLVVVYVRRAWEHGLVESEAERVR